MPHKPLAASEKFYKQSGAGLYGDVLAELDWSVGQVLDKLSELGLDEQTLVLFTSDNGPWFGGSTGGLRGMKSKTWEGGLRVPAIFRWPGQIKPAQEIGQLAGMIDVLPTVLNAANLPLPNERPLDGVSLWPLLTGGEKSPERVLFAMQGRELMTVRRGKWKLHVRAPGVNRYLADGDHWIDPRAPDGVTILAPYEQYPGVQTSDEQQPMMLFDISADPAEQHNVAAEQPDVVRQLKSAYDEMHERFRAAVK